MRYFVTVHFGRGGIKVSGDSVDIWIKSPPERGRANNELVQKLAEHFGVLESGVRIVSGAKSRKKVVEV
ncbi:MAG: DUF167 domain-containing protein [Nitrososphaera sp.]